MNKLEILMPIIFAAFAVSLVNVHLSLSIIAVILSIYYSSLNIHDYYKKHKKEKTIKENKIKRNDYND